MNRYEDILRLLKSIFDETILPKEIIILDQSKIKYNLSAVSPPKNIIVKHVWDSNITGLCNAKNIGVVLSSTDLLFFFDDDILLQGNYFEDFLKVVENNENISGFCARQKNVKHSKTKIAIHSLFNRGPFKDIRKKCNSGYCFEDVTITNIISGGITVYKKEVFEKYKFDECLVKYSLGEDMDFSYRVSKDYNLAFCSSVEAIHNHSNQGRYDVVDQIATKVASLYYFYIKNVQKTAQNYMYLRLTRLGIFTHSIYLGIRTLSIKPLKGYIRGLRYVKGNFKNVPFIDYEKWIKFNEGNTV